MAEFVADTEHIFNLVLCDPKFDDLFKTLTHKEAMHAVTDAFNLLYKTSTPEEDISNLDITPEGCLAISLLLQFLVCLMSKRMMQLMTPEAVILNRNKIPLFYLNHYLRFQAHFSLKEVISIYHNANKATNM